MNKDAQLLALFMYGAKSSKTHTTKCLVCAPIHETSNEEVVSELEEFLNGKINSSKNVEDMLEMLEIKGVSARDYIYKLHMKGHLQAFQRKGISSPEEHKTALFHAINFYRILSVSDDSIATGRSLINAEINNNLYAFPFQVEGLVGKSVSAHLNQILEFIPEKHERSYIQISRNYFKKIGLISGYLK